MSRSRFFKLRLFSRDFVLSRFLSRLSRQIKIVETNQDCRDLSRNLDIIETFDYEKDKKYEQEICRNPLRYFSIEIKTNYREIMKFTGLDEFLDLERDF